VHTRFFIIQDAANQDKLLEYFKINNCDIEIINYLEIDLDVSLIKDVLNKLSLKPRDILRTSEQDYKDNNLKEDDLPD
jgi:arsenate reductase